MKIVCDTNVFVSAVFSEGNCRDILRLVSKGRVKAFVTTAILLEIEEVLQRAKFNLNAAQVGATIKKQREAFRLVLPLKAINAVPDDPDDNAILEAAIAANADVIVSGDNHLLSLESFQGVRILTPAQFLAEFAMRASCSETGPAEN